MPYSKQKQDTFKNKEDTVNRIPCSEQPSQNSKTQKQYEITFKETRPKDTLLKTRETTLTYWTRTNLKKIVTVTMERKMRLKKVRPPNQTTLEKETKAKLDRTRQNSKGLRKHLTNKDEARRQETTCNEHVILENKPKQRSTGKKLRLGKGDKDRKLKSNWQTETMLAYQRRRVTRPTLKKTETKLGKTKQNRRLTIRRRSSSNQIKQSKRSTK